MMFVFERFLLICSVILLGLDFVHGGDGRSTLDEAIINTPQTKVECGIWLAPSTITGAGLGMFAGRTFQEDEEILPTGDSMVPIIDIREHRSTMKKEGTFLWDEYVWDGFTMLADYEAQFDVHMASPGLGSAANSFLPIYNVEEWHARHDYVGLHRSRDPGVGAFSPYHDRKSTARYPIEAGEELFVSYSAAWFEGRPHFGPVPTEDNFDSVQSLINKYKVLRSKIGSVLASNVWETFVKNTVYVESRVIGSFHHSDPDEMTILTDGDLTMEELRREQSSRSIEWLEEHGACGDHITTKDSTLPQAGRGAFATRKLPKGTILAQLPMIHIRDRSILDMYNYALVQEEDQAVYRPSIAMGKMGTQLLLNYCYGHAESTLLLCPYGPLTNYINHNQSLTNVKIVWGRAESGNHMPHLLQQSISSIEDGTAKLAMEIVTIRDINGDEEVFLDYGDEWEAAWQDHLRTWNPVNGANKYKSASQLNSDFTLQLPTVFEVLNHTADALPPNLGVKCDHGYVNKWEQHYSDVTLDHFSIYHQPNFWECEILRRNILEDGFTVYTVHMYPQKKDENDEEELQDNSIITELPRIAIRYHDKPLTSDIHLPNAFRHDIRIPDEIFPHSWRNKVE